MDGATFRKLTEPTAELALAMGRWENDTELVPFIRHCPTQEDLCRQKVVSVEVIQERLKTHEWYLIYAGDILVGEISYQIDPDVCMRKVPGTAWIGINIAEKEARHKGIGYAAMNFIEGEILRKGLSRIELGVFEFNETARRLYQRLGYDEIGRINGFTYWKGRMWSDIRMEKVL